MENLPKDEGQQPEEEKTAAKGTSDEKADQQPPQEKTPKVDRKHDFTHTHPDHAHHKNFGLDHEPGAF